MNDSTLNIITEEIQKDGKDSYHFHRYEPTPYEVLDELFDQYPLSPQDVLVDFGCGLGRLNFYAEYLFHCQNVGVELSDEYFERAQNNKASYIGNAERITFVNQKAEDYVIKNNETIFYFFNPFSPEIFDKVIRHIEQSYEQAPRTITVILYYPEDDFVFFMENRTEFVRKDEFAASDNVAKDRRERFCMYQLVGMT